MKKRSLTIVVLVILGVILGVIVVDFLNNRPDRRGANPYALDVDQYREVDKALISHRETRNFSLGVMAPSGIFYYNRSLFISGNSSLVVLALDGSPTLRYETLPHSTCIAVNETYIFIGFPSFVAKYDHSGQLLQQWDDLGERTVITSLAIKEGKVFVADAGNRRVLVYNHEGDLVAEFEGDAESEAGHGFIVPSANFDLAVNSFGELWVVNPGKHALENYSDEGRLRGFWENSSVEIEGFLGCCNPARFAVMNDGSFVTSEKGIVRIKIYDQSGKLKSVVAPPDLFIKDGKAPDVCVDEKGVVYALDFDKGMVRVFEPIKSVTD